MSKHNHRFEKAVTIAAQEGYWKYWDGIWKYGMITFWYLILPFFTRIFGYFPGRKIGLPEDLPKGVALEWASWGRNKNWFFDSLAEARTNFPEFRSRLLGISIDDDNYAPKRSVDALMKRYENAEVIRMHIHSQDLGMENIGHFNLFRKKFENTAWKEVLQFLKSK